MHSTLRSMLFCLITAGLIATAAACSAEPSAPNDAGHDHTEDAGQQADAGTNDAGSDAGSDAGTDAGQEPWDGGQEPIDAGQDAGEQDGGDTDGGELDAGCADPQVPVLWQEIDQDWGWPIVDPPCYQTPADCDRIFTVRFTDQSTFDTWYADELQRTAPTVNFNYADVLVTYSCGCPTMGYAIKTTDVLASSCKATQVATFEKPDLDSCFLQQTFTRPFSTVTVVKDAGVTEDSLITVQLNVCQ